MEHVEKSVLAFDGHIEPVGLDAGGEVVVRNKFSRKQLLRFTRQSPGGND